MLDLPFYTHWPKLALFLAYEGCLAGLTIMDGWVSALDGGGGGALFHHA